jgi:hypothetical protein
LPKGDVPRRNARLISRTHDYYRHGTVTLFAALDYLQGKIIAQTDRRHTHREWLGFLKQIDTQTPADMQLHLIVDFGDLTWMDRPKDRLYLGGGRDWGLRPIHSFIPQLLKASLYQCPS